MTIEEINEEFGYDCIYGRLDYHEEASLSIDDGGRISTIELTPVPSVDE